MWQIELMMLKQVFQNFQKQFPETKNFIIAYSGGIDSHVLLHQFATFFQQNNTGHLQAIHINHGLNPKADQWAKHCQTICNAFNIPLEIITIDANAKNGESPEDFARQLRYQVFENCIQKNDCLLTAHHQDDQAETLLLQCFRGAGPKGLAAMPSIVPFSKGVHWRPFLSLSRSQIHEYAIEKQLKWIEDDSNQNIKFDRNFIRHEVMPLLKTRWPSIHKTLARSASHCAETMNCLEEYLQNDLNCLIGTKENTLSVKQLLKLSEARRNNCIRYWITYNNFPIPSTIKLKTIINNVLLAREDATPCVTWDGGEIQRYRDDLYLMEPLLPFDNQVEIRWNLHEHCQLPSNLGYLSATQTPSGHLSSRIGSELIVRFRQQGERCQLAGRGCHHSLKHLFQEWGVPPWMRDRIPLLYCGNELVAIVGYGVCEGFQAQQDDSGCWEVRLSSKKIIQSNNTRN